MYTYMIYINISTSLFSDLIYKTEGSNNDENDKDTSSLHPSNKTFNKEDYKHDLDYKYNFDYKLDNSLLDFIIKNLKENSFLDFIIKILKDIFS